MAVSAMFILLICSSFLMVESGSVEHKNPAETLSRSFVTDFTGRLLNPLMLLFIPFLAIGFLLVGGLFIIQLISAFTVGGLGAGLGRRFDTVDLNRVEDLAKKFVTSEECVERVSCEMGNLAKYSGPMSQIKEWVQFYGKWTRMMRGLDATNDCSQFKCNPKKLITNK